MATSKLKEIKIKNFNYDFDKFFLKPTSCSSFKDVEIKIYETANKVGVWIIIFFLAYHFLKLIDYFFKMIWIGYTSVDIIIPDYFISIVSAIIGFYFGQRYTKTKE